MRKVTKIVIAIIVIVIAVMVYALFFEHAKAPENIIVSQSIPIDWTTYTDNSSGISLQAPANLATATSSSGLSLIFATTTPYVHTHLLHELRIDIAEPALDCVSMEQENVSASTTVAINGVDFERESWSGVGAGNLYQGIDYTVIKHALCYRITLFTHSTNGEGFYSNDPVEIKKIDALQAMDIKDMFALFDQIAGTIKFTK